MAEFYVAFVPELLFAGFTAHAAEFYIAFMSELLFTGLPAHMA